MIRAAGIRLIPFSLSRRRGNPLREVAALARLYRHECSAIMHHVAQKPVFYGALTSFMRVGYVPAPLSIYKHVYSCRLVVC